MTRKFLKRSAVCFSIAFTMGYAFIYACGGGDWDWDWTWETNFTPETFVDEKYYPLFLSQNLFYEYGSLGDGSTRFDEEIINDWSGYLKGKMEVESVSHFLSSKANAEVEDLYENKNTAAWSKKIDLKDKKVKAFFEFLHYGKIVEQYSLNEESWDYEETEVKILEDASLIADIEKKYESTNDDFLKNRYWFQVIKAYFYSNNRAEGIRFFEKTESKQPKNTLYYRAVSYIAGITGRLGNRGKSNYLYSRVFDKCPQLQQVAIFCFTPKEEKDWNESFAYAKKTDEKVALWAIQGYYTDPERAIRNIYSLNPKSEYLEFLLARLINQEELNIKSPEDETGEQNKKSTPDSSVLSLIEKIAQSGKIKKPYLWNCAAGYLQTLNGNYAKADAYLAKSEKEMPKTDLAIKQLRLLKFVNHLSKLKNITPKDEAGLVADLNWLYFELRDKEEGESRFRYQNAVGWSKGYLATLYRSQDNPVMADLFMRDPSFYQDDSQLLAMKAFLSKKDKTPFEEIGSKIYEVKLEDISKYQSVRAAYQDKITDAIAYMNETESIKADEFRGNPFNGTIKDCHDCDFLAPQKRKYSQLDFLKIIREMQDKIARNEDVYTNAMLVGNAFYNITYFGNARLFYESIIIGDGNTEFDFDNEYRTLITDCSLAQKYYKLAFSAAKNKEQQAKMIYMLSKCERNDFYSDRNSQFKNYWEVNNKDVDFIAWDGFKTLKKDYSKTKFYQEVIAECGYFRTYVAQNKK